MLICQGSNLVQNIAPRTINMKSFFASTLKSEGSCRMSSDRSLKVSYDRSRSELILQLASGYFSYDHT